MAVKAIIFDFDGVVIDSEPLYQQAEQRLLAEYGIQVPAEHWRFFKGTTEETFYHLLCERYGLQADFLTFRDRGRALLVQAFLTGNLDYMPGFLDFYQGYHSRFKMGLVTATPYEFMHWIFTHTHVKNLFSELITGNDVTQPKPAPQPYLLMCDRLQVHPTEAIIIEDSLCGLQAALSAGATVIGFLSSLTAAELPPGVLPARSYHEVTKLVEKLAG